MKNNSKYWIVTDLDGTLMDEDYDITPAKKTLKILAELNIPVIPCTSKTASEVRHFRKENALTDPFIVENGAAVYGCYELTGLSDQGITRALDRCWSVPFLNPPDDIFENVKFICDFYNVHVFKGNRMSHLLSSESHKGKAVNKLKVYLQNNDVKIIALGDSQNDLPLLEYADIAIVIPGKNGPNKYLQNGIDNGSFRLANAPHAEGWANSVQDIIKDFKDL